MEPKPKPKKVKFDIMIGLWFFKTMTMEYTGDVVNVYDIERYVEERFPVTLKNKNYKIYFYEGYEKDNKHKM